MHLPGRLSGTAAVLSLILISGCAVMKKDNRVLLNALDDSLSNSFITTSTTSKIASSPVIAPLAIGAGTIDTVIIIPARAVGPAIGDTNLYLWKNPEGSDLRKAMLFLPKAIVTPIVFIGSWTVRSLFTSEF